MTESLGRGVKVKHHLHAVAAAVKVWATRLVHHHHGYWLVPSILLTVPLHPFSLQARPCQVFIPPSRPPSRGCTRCGRPAATLLLTDPSSFPRPAPPAPTHPLLLENLHVLQGRSHPCACFPPPRHPGGHLPACAPLPRQHEAKGGPRAAPPAAHVRGTRDPGSR